MSIIDNVKRYAALVFASNKQRRRINVNTTGIDNKVLTATDNEGENKGQENGNSNSQKNNQTQQQKNQQNQQRSTQNIRLNDRSPQDKANYLRNYNWGRQLCPKAKVGQRCSDADFQRCTAIHRHLWTPAEKAVILNGAVPEGGPTVFSDCLLYTSPSPRD